ncbi:transmembrane protease serine 11D-like [Zerene cesonia]|uniref:transmembrane protease serine 11D-like n=1 Tax=Zerene cesonia TaxID=33412 RepID=UPI0018E51DFE|nr:transmembrane protease serine 11D-like [Zerene cesonia]
MGFMIYGLEAAWISPTTKKLQAIDSPLGAPVSNQEISLLASISCFSSALFVPIHSLLADRFGRKWIVFSITIPTILSIVIRIMIPNLTALAIARVAAGISASGIFAVTPVYIREMSQDNLIGILGSLSVLMQNLGFLAMYLIGAYFDYFTVLWIYLAFPLAMGVLILKAPESPAFLVKRGKIDEAYRAIAFLRGRKTDDKEVKTEIEYMQNQEETFSNLPKVDLKAISSTTSRTEMECEFPPKMEEDLTHVRRKRLTTEMGLVCLEDYPYTVSIRLHGKHWCGGAIVGKQWVLTAAQCFDYVSKEEVSVRMGSVFRDFGGRILAVTDIRRHPDYRTDQYYPEHNLAMIKMNIPIMLSSRVQVVSVATTGSDLPSLFGETIVTGFGSVVTGQIREGENQELRRMIVKEMSRADCRRMYGNDYRLQHDHMCLQSVMKGVALCAGDTGDPAVHFSGLNRAGTLHGIALFSGTEECALKSKPGVYAKVAYSKAWIDKILNNQDVNESADSGDNTIPIDI